MPKNPAQRAPGESCVHVHAGCRHYTLAQAHRHWSEMALSGWKQGRGRQALLIIALMVQQAKLLNLLPRDVQFDPKPKRRPK